MKSYKVLKTTTFFLLLICSINVIAQDYSNNDNGNSDAPAKQEFKKGFRLGLYIGSYFPNKYTASIYDGYGFNVDGNKNNFQNSFMNQKINIIYGGYGYSGQTDQIAQALNVNYHTWTFDETDMPTNMRYTPAFLIGLNTIYAVDTSNAIMLNVNIAQLAVGGNFTIETLPPVNSTQINNSIKTFPIVGGEKRLQLQLGYQRVLGHNEKANFFIEGGGMVTISEFTNNEVMINNLTIDLTSYYNSTYLPTNTVFKKPIGTGFGAFIGLGVNITINPKYTIQLVYNATYEKINIGANPALKLQNSVGLRAYYNF
ncbi:MAG TPA: hypothetical protein VNG53_07080 [Bacteroidia bacterium]|nr:hypothetical protein [Bacteroidia bacterium]